MTEQDDGAAAVAAIRRELSLEEGVERFASGSVPVFAVGGHHVVKLFPATQGSFFHTERAALARLDGALAVPAPRVIASGEHGPWHYLAMTRLPGHTLTEVWDAIGVDDRIRLMREAGEALAALHATGEIAFLAVDWPRFMETQRASCRDRQLAKGLGAPWVDAIDDFLARWTPRDDGARVLLHTEIMRDHLMAERRDGAWRLSGILDFEDAMEGAPEYEFAPAGLFLTAAEPELLQSLLEGYGREADEELPYRLMAYALLHRYSNLRWYLERLPAAGAAGDLESLARAWFT
jgi:hygromycin-B 7''-O-kinase